MTNLAGISSDASTLVNTVRVLDMTPPAGITIVVFPDPLVGPTLEFIFLSRALVSGIATTTDALSRTLTILYADGTSLSFSILEADVIALEWDIFAALIQSWIFGRPALVDQLISAGSFQTIWTASYAAFA